MNLPTFPTDNLYKFLAISGLVTLAFTAVFPFFILRQVSLELVSVKSEIAAIKLEAEHLENLLKLAKETPEYLAEATEILERNSQLLLKMQELDGKNEELRFRNDEISKYTLLLIALFLGSSIATAVGFRLWYTKLQRYQDQAVALQGSKLIDSDDST